MTDSKPSSLFNRPGLWVFLFAFFFCSCLMSGHLYSPDEEVLFRTARSMASLQGGAIEPLGGYITVAGPGGEPVQVYQKGFATRSGRGGKEYAQYGIGQPLLAVPFVWLARLAAPHLPQAFLEALVYRGVQYHEGTPVAFAMRFPVTRFNQLITALTCWLIYWLCVNLYGSRRLGILTALAYLTATMALPHSKTFFTEPLAALGALASLALARKAFDDEPPRTGLLALSGFCFGFAVLTRMDSLMMGPGLGLYVLWKLWRRCNADWKSILTGALRWGVPIAACLVIILTLNTIRFGSPLASGYSDQPEGVKFSTPLLKGLWGFAASPGRSLFIYSPPLLLAVIGLRGLWKRWRVFTTGLLVCAGIFLLFQAKWQNWSGGWDWGPRHIFQLIPLFMLGLPGFCLAAKKDSGRRLRLGLVVFFMSMGWCVNFFGVTASPIDAYSGLTPLEQKLSIYSFEYMPIRLHWEMIRGGQWDLLLPRLLGAPHWLVRLPAMLCIALMLLTGWLLWKNRKGPSLPPAQ